MAHRTNTPGYSATKRIPLNWRIVRDIQCENIVLECVSRKKPRLKIEIVFDCPLRAIRLPPPSDSITPSDRFDCPLRPIRRAQGRAVYSMWTEGSWGSKIPRRTAS